MGNPVLLLRLEGPLQSWGTRARWDIRDTAPEPTKSGVIGLLGCALGFERGDPRLEELDTELRFGVRIDSPGTVRSDFHTVTGYLPSAEGGFRHRGGTSTTQYDELHPERHSHLEPATIISKRYYIEDASFLVGLESKGDMQILKDCADALADPHWPIYLGRRSCPPSRPILIGLFENYRDLNDALRNHPWSWLGAGSRLRTRRRPAMLRAYIEDDQGPLTRQDRIRVNSARIYNFRQASEIHDIVPNIEEVVR